MGLGSQGADKKSSARWVLFPDWTVKLLLFSLFFSLRFSLTNIPVQHCLLLGSQRGRLEDQEQERSDSPGPVPGPKPVQSSTEVCGEHSQLEPSDAGNHPRRRNGGYH